MSELGAEAPAGVLRQPILDKESVIPTDRIERQWLIATEKVKRGMVAGQEERQKLLPFSTLPVSETLPQEFLVALTPVQSDDENISNPHNTELAKYLALPVVPDEIMEPDLANAAFHPKHLTGITSQEHDLVASRYRFARDVKVLALGAELLNLDAPPTPNAQGEILLPTAPLES